MELSFLPLITEIAYHTGLFNRQKEVLYATHNAFDVDESRGAGTHGAVVLDSVRDRGAEVPGDVRTKSHTTKPSKEGFSFFYLLQADPAVFP